MCYVVFRDLYPTGFLNFLFCFFVDAGGLKRALKCAHFILLRGMHGSIRLKLVYVYDFKITASKVVTLKLIRSLVFSW